MNHLQSTIMQNMALKPGPQVLMTRTCGPGLVVVWEVKYGKTAIASHTLTARLDAQRIQRLQRERQGLAQARMALHAGGSSAVQCSRGLHSYCPSADA